MTKLFVNIGRNRRVFPKDLANLFVRTLALKSSDIGEVKVLDNYSFIEIPAELAERAIKQLSGTVLGGRRIAIDLARSRQRKKR